VLYYLVNRYKLDGESSLNLVKGAVRRPYGSTKEVEYFSFFGRKWL